LRTTAALGDERLGVHLLRTRVEKKLRAGGSAARPNRKLYRRRPARAPCRGQAARQCSGYGRQ